MTEQMRDVDDHHLPNAAPSNPYSPIINLCGLRSSREDSCGCSGGRTRDVGLRGNADTVRQASFLPHRWSTSKDARLWPGDNSKQGNLHIL